MRPVTAASDSDEQDAARWIAAGLDQLTGPADGPALGPPTGLLARLDALTVRLSESGRALGRPVDVDPLTELAVRAEPPGHRRRGQVSCGGACHLVEAIDGWFAVSLARPDDWELVPAWLGIERCAEGDWEQVHHRSAGSTVGELVEGGSVLGLPIGALAEQRDVRPGRFVPVEPSSPPAVHGRGSSLRVADLSSMWAGPLCGSILADAGAEVLKVESAQRPDGTRRGSPELHERWNGSKQHVVVDLDESNGVEELRTILRSVDLVLESSRPRALEQLGISAEQLLAEPDGPTLWVSITGHGRDTANAHRVAFGDDAAVSGGLVRWWQGRPLFCADAVADPLTGLWAATAALEAVATGRRGLIDVAMSRVAAHFGAGVDGEGDGAGDGTGGQR